jgi:hypothetical protein
MHLLTNKEWDNLQQQLQCKDQELQSLHELVQKQQDLLQQAEVEANQVYKVFDIHNSIPNLVEIFDVIKHLTPLMREKIVEYIAYY